MLVLMRCSGSALVLVLELREFHQRVFVVAARFALNAVTRVLEVEQLALDGVAGAAVAKATRGRKGRGCTAAV